MNSFANSGCIRSNCSCFPPEACGFGVEQRHHTWEQRRSLTPAFGLAQRLLLLEKSSVANLLSSSLICFLFQKTTMLGRCIAAEVNSAGITAILSPLPCGSAGSSVHGIELSDLAQWAFNQALWRTPTIAHFPVLHTTAFQKSSRNSLQTVFGDEYFQLRQAI